MSLLEHLTARACGAWPLSECMMMRTVIDGDLVIIAVEDRNKHCQEVCKAILRFWRAYFPDIMDRFSVTIDLGEPFFQMKARKLFTTPALKQAVCVRHGMYCPCPVVHGDVSGPPCTDWSREGQQAGWDGASLNLSEVRLCSCYICSCYLPDVFAS